MNKKNSTERAVKAAFASARMEGLKITPNIEQNVRRIIDGKITVEERVRQIKAENKQRIK